MHMDKCLSSFKGFAEKSNGMRGSKNTVQRKSKFDADSFFFFFFSLLCDSPSRLQYNCIQLLKSAHFLTSSPPLSLSLLSPVSEASPSFISVNFMLQRTLNRERRVSETPSTVGCGVVWCDVVYRGKGLVFVSSVAPIFFFSCQLAVAGCFFFWFLIANLASHSTQVVFDLVRVTKVRVQEERKKKKREERASISFTGVNLVCLMGHSFNLCHPSHPVSLCVSHYRELIVRSTKRGQEGRKRRTKERASGPGKKREKKKEEKKEGRRKRKKKR